MFTTLEIVGIVSWATLLTAWCLKEVLGVKKLTWFACLSSSWTCLRLIVRWANLFCYLALRRSCLIVICYRHRTLWSVKIRCSSKPSWFAWLGLVCLGCTCYSICWRFFAAWRLRNVNGFVTLYHHGFWIVDRFQTHRLISVWKVLKVKFEVSLVGEGILVYKVLN